MCLNRVISKSKAGDKKSYIGYKCFDPSRDTYEFPFYNYNMTFKLNERLTANRVTIYTKGKRYTSGFHIFKTAKAAIEYRRHGAVVFKVRYSGNITRGLQGTRRCDVAKYMTILGKV